MNIEELQAGQTFKNYKELCNEIGWEIKKSANSRNSQLKELSRYCKYNKIGHKFTIEEVYESPLPKIDNRGGSYNSIYGDIIQLLIADLLAQCDGYISISRSKLMLTIGMINTNYSDCRELVPKLAIYAEMNENFVYDFYNTNSSNFKSAIETALKNLMDKRVIMYNTVIKVKEKGSYNTRLATKFELENIMNIEKTTFEEMGYTQISQVRASKEWKTFRVKTKQLLNEYTDIEFYFTAYDITVNEKYIVEERNQLVGLLLEKAKRKETKNELNQIVYTHILHNAQKRHDKALVSEEDVKMKRNDSSYVGNIKHLADILISKDTPNILHKIKSIKLDEVFFVQEIEEELDRLFS